MSVANTALFTRTHFSAFAPTDPAILDARIRQAYAERDNLHRLDRLLNGSVPGTDAILMRTNDYLGLAAHPRIIGAEISALEEGGHGDSLSRIFAHRREDRHRAFERRLATLMKAEDAVLCMSGYCANVGLIQTIAQPDMPIYLDMLAHASLWEGVKSAGAVARPFRHNDPGHLERQIAAYGPGVIAIDALYSTSGHIAPLAAFCDVAERTGCVLVVDETHSFGAHGTDGAGLVEAAGLTGRVHFRTLGLSKAVASRGGAIVCSARNADFFRYESMPMIFSTSVLAHEVAGFEAALDVIRDEPWRRARLHANHARLRDGLDDLGYNVDISDSQIIALEAGTDDAIIAFRDAVEREGIFGSVFCAPATPRNRAILRFTVHCNLSDADIRGVLSALERVREEVDVAAWGSTRRRRGRNGRSVMAA